MPIHTALHSALADTYAATFRSLVEQYPSATAAELRDLVADYPPLGSLTLSQLFGGSGKKVASVTTKPAAKSKSAKTTSKPAAKPKTKATPKAAPTPGWEVRTEAGRAKLRAAVLEGLRAHGAENVAAEQLRSLGATPHQLRATLNHLIDDGLVGYTGKARGTRYSLV